MYCSYSTPTSQLPYQAIRCNLADVGPMADQWEDTTAGDFLWNMCSEEDQEQEDPRKTMKMKVGFLEGGDIVDRTSRSYSILCFTTCVNLCIFNQRWAGHLARQYANRWMLKGTKWTQEHVLYEGEVHR